MYHEQVSHGVFIPSYIQQGYGPSYSQPSIFGKENIPVVEEGQKIIISVASNPKLCLSVKGDDMNNRARIILFDYSEQENQIWIRKEKSLESKKSGRVLDIQGGEGEGNNIIQFNGNKSPNQQFEIIRTYNNPNVVKITSPSGLAITVKGNNINKNGEIIASKYKGDSNQHWVLSYL